MVLKNLEENGYISKKDLKIFKKNIKLNKRKVLLVEEAQSFTEEVRRIINTEYGFKKYTQKVFNQHAIEWQIPDCCLKCFKIWN